MFPWQDFFILILRELLNVVLEPMFWLVLGLVAFQYRRLRQDQQRILGVHSFSLGRQVAAAALYGVVGGAFGSLLLNWLGVAVNQLGLAYIWPVAIALMFVNMRFMCFAYAGGLVALASALFGWPAVNGPQVLALVAGLHIIEGLLIFVSGRYGAMPVFLKRPDGQMVGAFTLQNYWPLPLVLFAAVSLPEASLPAGGLNMPDWWPLLPVGEVLPTGRTWLYSLLPVVAVLGYADLAITSTPATRRRVSALNLSLYSGGLLVLALLSVNHLWLQIIAATLSPVGHEMLIQLDNRREMLGKPRFVPPDRGVMVLDTVVGTPARRLGFQPGDILLDLAGLPTDSGYDLARVISVAPAEFYLTVSRAGVVRRLSGRFADGERRLGIILVPDGTEHHYIQPAPNRYGLFDWLQRCRRR